MVEHSTGTKYVATVRGHEVRVDQPLAAGGTDEAPTSSELLVASLATDVGYYAGQYLEPHGLSRTGFAVYAEYHMADRAPARIGSIHLRVIVPAGLPVGLVRPLRSVVSAHRGHPDRRSSGPGLKASPQAAQKRVRRRLVLKPHPGVHRDETIRSGNDRVEIDLGDLGMVRCELREPDQGLFQASHIHGRLASVPLQQRGGARSSHQLSGVDVGEGREPDGTVGQDVGRHTAQSKYDERPEDRFLDHSSEHFDARCGH